MGRAGPSLAACAEPPRRTSLAVVCLLATLGPLLGSEITCRRLLTANENLEGFQFMTMRAVEERAVKLQFACWDGDGQLQTPCRIQKCTTDFVSLTSHLNSALESFDLEFCKALRAYSACTYRNSKVCRGNLVYHSAVLGISDLMSQRNCSKDGPTSSSNPEVTHDLCNYSGHPEAREHQGGEKTAPLTYLFCGLFGDPHLRTFKDHFQTCKVEGAWPLIDNNYLSVQVTNVPVVAGSSATATNKITIIFKSYQDCTDQKVYQAVTDDLPAAFVDGTTSGGDGNTKSLRIVEKISGKYIEMHARSSKCLCYRRIYIVFMLGNPTVYQSLPNLLDVVHEYTTYIQKATRPPRPFCTGFFPPRASGEQQGNDTKKKQESETKRKQEME
ncbi:repulsive guidance molecule B isoform X4 [Lathamus discolor]|uniref:repulsive guidance molecule B isoform X4 n=1 Tax=Lathamus discolor TaxID=678569 RepID=UPI0032B7AE97